MRLIELGFMLAAGLQGAQSGGELERHSPGIRAHTKPQAARVESETDHRLVWRYPRFRTWQYVASSVLTAGIFSVEVLDAQYPDHGWQGGVLFDNWVRKRLHVGSREGRDRADFWSNVSWPVVQWYPVLIDSLLVPLVTDDMNWDVVQQLELINWQVFATAGFATRLTQYVIGRSRPAIAECARDPDYSKACDPNYFAKTASFLSGHTSMTFAAAAMACAHHAELPLYGGGAADAGACAVLLMGATGTGVLRIMADQHWPTDVLAGAVVGLTVGYAIPMGLHYSRGRIDRSSTTKVMLAPFASDTALGVAAFGIW